MRFDQLLFSWAPVRAKIALSICFLNAVVAWHCCAYYCRPWTATPTQVRIQPTVLLDERFLSFVAVERRRIATQALLESSPDKSAEAVAVLNQRRSELQQERRQVTKEIKNENRKRKRLLVKAKGLTQDDLVDVMIMKAQVKAKAQAKSSAG